MSEDDELGTFEEFQGGPDSEANPDTTDEDHGDEPEPADLPDMDPGEDGSGMAAVHAAGPAHDPRDNPLDIDPVPGKWDLCYDRAKPGAKVYVVDVLAESVEAYQEDYPNAPELDTFEGNVVVRMRPEDRVLAAIYVDSSLTSTPDTAYPMPESRLTRVPAEEASLIGNGSVEFARPPTEGE